MRDIAEIEDEMDAAIAADPVLSTRLTSTSRTAIYRLWRHIVALAAKTLEALFDTHKKDIENLMSQGQHGLPGWYAQKSLEFQLGDNLTIVDGKPAYAVVDPSKRIVTRASVTEGATGGILVKVAKGSPGALLPLTSVEKQAFVAYLNKIKFAGIFTNTISLSADLLKGQIQVFHNGLKLTGDLEDELNEVVKAHLAQIQFDGRLVITQLIDALQAVDGVTDVVVLSIQVKAASDIYRTVNRVSNPASGYFLLDEAGGGITWTLTQE